MQDFVHRQYDEHRTSSSEPCVIIRTTKENLSFPDAEQLSNNRPTNCRHLCRSSLTTSQKKRKTPIWDLSWNFQKLHHIKPLVLSKGWLYEKKIQRNCSDASSVLPFEPTKNCLDVPVKLVKSLVSGLWPQIYPIKKIGYFTHWS